MASSSGECPAYGLLSAALTGDLNLLKKSIADLDDGVGLAKTIEDVQDCQGRTALHYAASEGRAYICKYLVQGLKLDVNMKDGEGLKELMRLLILKSAAIDKKSDTGTSLHYAAAQGKKDAVKILLDKKANPNAVCHHIFTPLVNSLFSGSFECTSLLLKPGADPNLVQLNGESLLGFAASQGEAEVMKCLLKAGANPNVTNYIGLTPLEIAVLHGNHEKREQKKNESFLLSKSKGEAASKEKAYIDANILAIDACPSNAVFSNRSLCWARLNEGIPALSDAEACVMMRPDWEKAHYREGVAWRLLKHIEALKLDPENKELETAFREAVIGVYEGNSL